MSSLDDQSPFAPEAPVPEGAAPEAEADVGTWKVLIVDDEPEIHDVTTLALRGLRFGGRGLSFLGAKTAREARTVLAEHRDVALVLLDVVMETDDAGLTLVRHIRDTLRNAACRVVLRTGQPGHAPEVAIIREYDISDYRTKTELTTTRLYTTVIAALRAYEQLLRAEAQRAEIERLYEEQRKVLVEVSTLRAELERERDYLREELDASHPHGDIVGESPRFSSVLRQLDAVAASDATVLLLGESGVGKEVAARALHARSARAGRPLVKVNCAGIPRELFESEFFGHVRGAFTGAHKDRVGRFALADKGTLFLDEVGEIPLDLQAKLLRALQEREVERIGDARPLRVDVRIVAATNRDLRVAVAEGAFRADLYYRLSVFPLAIPPLRDRKEDIVPLFEHVMARLCRRYGRRFMPLSPEQARAVTEYAWPGNVRELENVVERALILSSDGVLRLEDALPELDQTRPSGTPSPGPVTLPPDRDEVLTAAQLRELERRNLIRALELADWRISGQGGAAELLGLAPSTLTYQMRSLGIERARSA